ncbi:uncharacterized protein LOC124896657 [Capsicum annuum]|uniref:uncharacterized protein LOC124896657 n=1 Tax=Capsicum annuum TaxID=4072 RepID=UPI001FB1987C|nr:uncharacterized protein LOC124896657 [Capsicum annuum]
MECITTTKYALALNGGVYGEIKGKRGLQQGEPISPLIFVICMKYFSRIMDWMADHEGFAFHTKCRSLRLNHLCFADDMLLFCKGEFKSVVLMLRGLKTFSFASGLCTNASKSSIFFVNINSQVLENLKELTGYNTGSLPFKYLGVPISTIKLSSMDCEVLLDKMTSRIKTWGTRNLSYAGQLGGTPSGTSDPPTPVHSALLDPQPGDRDDYGRIYLIPFAIGFRPNAKVG